MKIYQALQIYRQAFYRPRKTLEILTKSETPLQWGCIFISIPVIAYTLMYIFLTIAEGAPSVFTPWLNIPKEKYYAINRFLLAPSMIICWLLASSFIQVCSKMFGGTGTFEQTLTAISLSISISMWGALLHDFPMSFLSAVGVIDAAQHEIAMNTPTIFRTLLWIFYSIYFFAFLFLFTLTVRIVHNLSPLKSMTTGISGFLLFQLIFLVFNR